MRARVRSAGSLREHQARCTCARGVNFVGAGEGVNAHKGNVLGDQVRCTLA